MHIFRSGKGPSRSAQDSSDPMQLIRTRSASDRFPAFSKAASRSQVFMDSKRAFNRSMSAQEAEKRNDEELDQIIKDSIPILPSSGQDDKENIFQSQMYESDSYTHSNTSNLRPLHYARSIDNLNVKKEESRRSKESSCTQLHRSPLRERRQKSPLTIQAPAPPNFKRPRAKSSASFGTIYSPPPCPPPTTPLPELPSSSNSSMMNKQAGDLLVASQHLHSLSSPIARESPFEQAWRSNREQMERKADLAHIAFSSASSSYSPSPVSIEGDDSGEVNVLQLHQPFPPSQSPISIAKIDPADKLPFPTEFGLSSLVNQINWGQIPDANTRIEHRHTPDWNSKEAELIDDNCVYGLAM